jgi:uncharacterized membrane protein YbhN (UPF0104 family)
LTDQRTPDDQLREASAADGYIPPLDLPPNPEASPESSRPPSRRDAIIRTGIVVGVVAFMFFFFLPVVVGVDYAEVAQSLQGLTAQDVLLVAIFGVIAWVLTGAIFAALIRGLGILRGTEAWLILAGIGASIPMGPWNMAVLWVVIRGWGLSPVETTGGIALYGIFDQLSRLGIGVIAAFGLVVAEGLGRDISIQSGAIWTWGVVSLVILVVASGLLVAIVRSERLAERIGDLGQRVVTAIIGRFKRFRVPDVRTATIHFRVTLGDTIRQRGLVAFIASVLSKLAWSVVLLVGLRVVGISERELPYTEILAVYAAVMIITILPISPGGAGVPGALYISMFTTLLGADASAQITAGVLLFRTFQWFLPIPFAWILLGRSRRGKSLLPTAAELRGRSEAQATAAPATSETASA